MKLAHRNGVPLRLCRGCGGDMYSWKEAPLCERCVAAARVAWETTESWRDFRKRLNAEHPAWPVD
jgi:hypothetical protein